MLAAAYAATRNLWVPIGLHFGWNFAAAGIFSAEVSGNGESTGCWTASTSGPALLTGGEFGPEASLYTVRGRCAGDDRVPVAGPPPRSPRARAGARPRPPRPLRSPSDRPPAGPGPVAAVGRHGPGSPARAAARPRVVPAGAARPRDAGRRPAGPPVRRAGRRGRSPWSAFRSPCAGGGRPPASPWCRSASPSTSSAATTWSRAPRCPSRC